MIKRKISKTEFAALPEVLQAEYKASGDSYVLDTDDATDLMSARDREKEARKAAEKEARDLQAKLDEMADNKNRVNGDVEALEKSWQKKFDDVVAERDTLKTSLDGERKDRYVTAEADRIAKRFTVPGLMRDVIAKRLAVELHDNKPIVRVLDASGKPSAHSLSDFEKELVDNPEYKGIVIASKANGSAMMPPPVGSATNPITPNNSPAKLTELPTKDLTAHIAGLIGNTD